MKKYFKNQFKIRRSCCHYRLSCCIGPHFIYFV